MSSTTNKKITKNIVFGDPPPSGAPTTFVNNTLLFEIGTGNIHQFVNGSWTMFSGPSRPEVLSNKTIDSPIISKIVNGSGTLTLPSSTTDTLVARTTSDTLTNKYIDVSVNTLTSASAAAG